MKMEITTQFKAVNLVTYFFQILFLVGSIISFHDYFLEYRISSIVGVFAMLFFSYKSFEFGMDYKMSFVNRVIDADTQFRSVKMNRRQRRKFKRTSKWLK